MAKNEIIPQYYNLYDSTKGYTELLFRAGKVLQSKELNELQSTIKNQIKNVGNTVLTNGDIIEGCQLIVADDRKSVTITNGRIYLEGDVREIEVTTVGITGRGTETIGVVLKSQPISPDDDPDLNDVATGYDNYNQDGAYRLQEYVEIVVNNSNAAILYTLIDGEQLSLNKNEDLTQLEKIQNTLARRTFDESGNYKVSGLTLSDKRQGDAEHIYVSLEQGKAYVRGYEVQRDTAYTVLLDRATELRVAENEPKTFRTGTSSYALNNNYVNSIKKIMGTVEVTQNITRGSIIGGIDPLPLKPAVEIVSITQGTRTYVNGTDFQLTADGVDWSIGFNAPNPGESYSCVWTYNKTMEQGTDYELTLSDDSTIGYINFLDGDKPVVGTTFLINYDYMLARIDVVSLDMRGNVIVTKGQSDVLRVVDTPSVDINEVLPIGSVLLTPMSDTPQIINNNTKSITMLDLYNLLQRVNIIEYNQAISDLDQEAASGESATELKGIFTDGFIGLSKMDNYYPENLNSMDFTEGILSTYFDKSIHSLVVSSESNPTIKQFNDILTLKGANSVIDKQSNATGVFRVNSYNAFLKIPVVELDPSQDIWTDPVTEYRDVQGDTIRLATKSFATVSQARAAGYANAVGYRTVNSSSTKRGVTGAEGSTTEAVEYMRQIDVTLKVENLEPMVDNIIVMFNNQKIEVSALAEAYQGTKTGTLKANGVGFTTGKFKIPANTQCGVVEVQVFAETSPNLVGVANFEARGTKNIAYTKVWEEITPVYVWDPVAQSFQFNTDKYITGVGLYFNAKNTADKPIIVQIKNLVSGFPGTIVYANKVISPDEISVSVDASVETQIEFDNPVYCKANEGYCVTVLSDSPEDSLWISETNKPDINTGISVDIDPFTTGVMFSSSNATTWTAHQSQDLKFNLYGLQFDSTNITGTVTFNKITGISYDRIELGSVESIPAGCSIQWQVSINDGSFLPIESGVVRELDEVATSLQFRAVLQGTLTNTPAINLNSVSVTGYTNVNEGAYVSKNINIPEGFNNIKVSVDMNLPTGTNTVLYYATDSSGTEWNALTNTGAVQKSIDYKTYTFENDLAELATNYRIKIAMTTNNPINRPKLQKLMSILKTV